MVRNKAMFGLVFFLLAGKILSVPNTVQAAEIGEVVTSLADWLEASQYEGGMLAGAWPGEEAYTGSLVAGLIAAYEVTFNEDYEAAAIAGGDFILRVANGNYYGDEAYALARLSRITEDETQNVWRSAVAEFYQNVRNRAEGGTAGYVAQFELTQLTRAVFYLAHHTVAASYVDAEDKDVWREALLSFLSRVDDDSTDFPVMALGIATWALAETGPLDDFLVDVEAQGVTYWQGVTLADLPRLLAGHQVTEGDLAGSFYGRFDHGDGGQGVAEAGYAEDLTLAVLGLAAAGRVVADPAIEVVLGNARNVLIEQIGVFGFVLQHLWYGGDAYLFYSGYALRALAELTPVTDVDLQDGTSGSDLAVLAGRWRDGAGYGDCLCGRAGINRDGRVDARDLNVFGHGWLTP